MYYPKKISTALSLELKAKKVLTFREKTELCPKQRLLLFYYIQLSGLGL